MALIDLDDLPEVEREVIEICYLILSYFFLEVGEVFFGLPQGVKVVSFEGWGDMG